jgi:hypothetical protein
MLPIQSRESQQKVLVTPKIKFEIPTMVLPIQNILMWGAIIGIAVLLYIKTDIQVTQVENLVETDTAKSVLANLATVEFTELDIDEVEERSFIIDSLLKAEKETAESKVYVAKLKSKTASPYTLVNPTGVRTYEIVAWILQAEEKFTPHFYWDGKKKAIFFGKNIHPDYTKTPWKDPAISKYLKDGVATWSDGIASLQDHIKNHINPMIIKAEEKRLAQGKPRFTEQQKAALTLYAYNAGQIDRFGSCCGAKFGCGRNKNTNEYKAHTRRRQTEARLYNGKITPAEIEAYRKAALYQSSQWIAMERKGEIKHYTQVTELPRKLKVKKKKK